MFASTFEKINSTMFDRAPSKSGPPPQAVLLAAVLCAALPFDTSQLLFMVLGAAFYFFVQQTQLSATRKPVRSDKFSVNKDLSSRPWQPRNGRWAQDRTSPSVARQRTSPAISRNPCSKDSLAPKDPSAYTHTPIQAPVLKSIGFDAEVDELVQQIMPSPESEQVVQTLAAAVRQGVRRLFPEADVIGFASGDFRRGKAFGVAVPEVEIVINVRPDILVNCLQGRQRTGFAPSSGRMDNAKLQKSAIRVITDMLVSKGGFKFRRSAFRGFEPKVTMLAPAFPGTDGEAIPIDLCVNAVMPLHNMALLRECNSIDARSNELILLVRRWSKDRGVCHAAKGHLSPYLWSLLAVYYLQVGVESEGQLIPALRSLESATGIKIQAASVPFKQAADQLSVAELFKGFVKFYHGFDWRAESISLSAGERVAPKMPLNIIAQDNSKSTEVGPNIEDPLQAGRNLGCIMNAASLARLHEELARAVDFCARGASILELLELWSPVEEQAKDKDDELAVE